MSSSHRSSIRVLLSPSAALLALCAASAGCAISTEEASESSSQTREVTLASVSLDDEEISFVQVQEGIVKVESSKEEESAALREAMEGADSLAGVYRKLAGENTEPEGLGALAEIDARGEALDAEQEALIAEYGPPPTAEESEQASQSSGPEVASTSQAYCVEPAGDWIGDDNWFHSTYCANGESYCATLKTSHATGWKNGIRFFRATGFAQSFCSTADFEVWYHTTWFNWGWHSKTAIIWDETIQPRHLRPNVYWVSDKKMDFKASISADQSGNWTGLAAYW